MASRMGRALAGLLALPVAQTFSSIPELSPPQPPVMPLLDCNWIDQSAYSNVLKPTLNKRCNFTPLRETGAGQGLTQAEFEMGSIEVAVSGPKCPGGSKMIEFTVDPRNGDISKGAFYNFFYTGDTGETNTRDGYDYGLSVLINAKDTGVGKAGFSRVDSLPTSFFMESENYREGPLNGSWALIRDIPNGLTRATLTCLRYFPAPFSTSVCPMGAWSRRAMEKVSDPSACRQQSLRTTISPSASTTSRPVRPEDARISTGSYCLVSITYDHRARPQSATFVCAGRTQPLSRGRCISLTTLGERGDRVKFLLLVCRCVC